VCRRMLSSLPHFSLLASELVSIYACWAAGVADTSLNSPGFHFRGNNLPMYALSRERVYNYHPDNDAFTAPCCTRNMNTEPLTGNGLPL
jgi:hypothetical protein